MMSHMSLAECCRSEEVKSSPYCPESDGLVERLNNTILNTSSKFVLRNQQIGIDGSLHLWHTKQQMSPGYSTFQLLCRRDAVIPVDNEF